MNKQKNLTVVQAEKEKFNKFIGNLTANKFQKNIFVPLYQRNSHNSGIFFKKNAFQGVKELYFSGGGGAGCAYPSAVKYASDFGLDLSKIEVVCGVSVGAIIALGIALNVEAKNLQIILSKMPTASFQDWSLYHIVRKFHRTWSICRGQAMPDYFKQLIKEKTGLDDPTFKELNDSGFKKELRIITTNISKGKQEVFSYKTTPDIKVAETVALSCSIPFVFPPKRIMNKEGSFDLHTDGGLIKSLPWGLGSKKGATEENRLGFALINSVSTEKEMSEREEKKILTFLEYVYHLFVLTVVQRPFDLTKKEKKRTIAIKLNYNPMNFAPSPAQQKYLDDQSYKAVEKLVKEWIEKKDLYNNDMNSRAKLK